MVAEHWTEQHQYRKCHSNSDVDDPIYGYGYGLRVYRYFECIDSGGSLKRRKYSDVQAGVPRRYTWHRTSSKRDHRRHGIGLQLRVGTVNRQPNLDGHSEFQFSDCSIGLNHRIAVN